MAAITAALVKELREKTGAGMMDCKKALTEAEGNMEAAVDWLRTKGLAAAAKKAGRVASEGLVAVAAGDNVAAVVEMNSETDFVARNETFQSFVKDLATLSVENDVDIDGLKKVSFPGTERDVDGQVVEMIATIGENMNLRRVERLTVSEGVVSSYVHSAVAPNLGKIGVLVALESAGDKEKLEAIGKQIAMHIAALKPEALDRDGVNSENLEREKAVYKEQAMAEGKPAEIAEKMVIGRVNKYYKQIVLKEQPFVMDDKVTVAQFVENSAAEVGAPVALTGFVRFELGDGIEKEESDFAAEVAAQLAS